MGAGGRDLKRKEASATKTESSDDSLKNIQAMALSATKPAAAGAGKKRKPMALLVKKPAAAGASKKRRKLVKTRLPQELVEEIMRRPVTPCPVIPDEMLAEFSVECRTAIAMQKADTEELMAMDADIIRQYKDKGYAEMEEEVTVNEQEKVEN